MSVHLGICALVTYLRALKIIFLLSEFPSRPFSDIFLLLSTQIHHKSLFIHTFLQEICFRKVSFMSSVGSLEAVPIWIKFRQWIHQLTYDI